MPSVLNSLKVLLISTWLLFTALGLNLSLPTITNFFATHVPLTWNLFLASLKPPYLFLLLNAIILTIAASSRFHLPTPPPPPPPPPYCYAYVTKPPPVPLPLVEEGPPAPVDVKPVVVNGVAATDEDGTVTSPAPTLDEVWRAITEGRAKERRRNIRTTPQRQPSHDELNRRVEAFIRKFNEEMRLEKQQPLNGSLLVGDEDPSHGFISSRTS